ncbi:putative Nucleoside diphosphatase [Taphrina deformans PYCC 5710]|uniref:Nucleoside diphosphatase n=1 Tax=Taphrina deformans (strain PYCC 5710 / ATCC 11124 / CBS 356.35 / IMI 108563 / JCM 9778 / NBRC 8474) TaxID=1097556 RepID=R4X812_TAPDE|nr:putative Nucleoside diphosphatase [Taphrina deformans PYCC 5710]|eukprot:CCG81584.1 putative Nucleoside diphosphatase [Taphrina deformans PYCC 5710]
MTSFASRAPINEWSTNRKYAVIIDAGSSGSRIQVYSWRDHSLAASFANQTELSSLPRIEKGVESGEDWMMKVHPGVSSFADDPSEIGEKHLKELYAYALKIVPADQVKETPVYLLATAGMRLLTEDQQEDILEEACEYTQDHTDFLLPECESHFQVITGETEGLYGWIAINYLLGGFDAKTDGNHHTYGFLDMGGASAQIAFVPNKTEAAAHKEDLTLLRLRTLEGETKEWQVFVSTWLGFGANEARRRYLESLAKGKVDQISGHFLDPCKPKGLVETVASTKDKKVISAEGSGNLNECLTRLEPLLSKNAPCPDPPCLFAGVHVPSIDFDINHFIGISEYYYSTQDVFGLGGAYDYHTLSNAVENYCSREWVDILQDLADGQYPSGVEQKKLEEVCFKASWMMNVLHDGIGIPRVTKEFSTDSSSHNGTEELREGARIKGFDGAFNSAESLAGTEVSWTLGKMVLYSSSSVESSNAEPVGFGPNSVDHTMFQIAGELESNYQRPGLAHRVHQNGASALVLCLCIIALLLYIIKGPRKASLMAGMSYFWHKNQRKIIGARGDQSYERVMEEGDAEEERQFQMGQLGRSSLTRSAVFSNGLARSSSQLRLSRSSKDGSDDEGVKRS